MRLVLHFIGFGDIRFIGICYVFLSQFCLNFSSGSAGLMIGLDDLRGLL